MKTNRRASRARLAAIGVAAVSAVLVAGCGAANEGGGGGGEGGQSQLSGSISGAGASSQSAAMQAWIAGFNGANPGATVNYDPVGSGGGREQFVAGGTAFGGTDSALDEEELPAALQRCGGNVIEIPAYISPIAVAFKLDGVTELNLKPQTIAGIFAKQITTWNAPQIAADNPGVQLPAVPITVVHRSDESGTTENFQEYLAATAPEIWTFEPSGNWPPEIQGEAGAQTAGVVQAINAGNGTIGYADASQVGQLGVTKVGVGNQFVPYSPQAAAAIVDASPQDDQGRPPGSFALELARDTTQAGTYPIVLVSYELACGTYPDQPTADLVKAFLSYVISPEGQQASAQNSGSAPISDGQRQQFQTAIDSIKAGA